jgi:hypothetical protein
MTCMCGGCVYDMHVWWVCLLHACVVGGVTVTCMCGGRVTATCVCGGQVTVTCTDMHVQWAHHHHMHVQSNKAFTQDNIAALLYKQ